MGSILFVAHRSRHISPKPTAGRSLVIDPARVARRYAAIIQGEGGDSVWIKRAAQPGVDRQEPAIGEVLALSSVAPRIISTLKKQAGREGLRLQVGAQNGSSQSWTVMVARDGESICGWRIRQVGRLYRAAIIIDDLGEDMKPARQALGLNSAITLSILPHLPASKQTADEAHRAGHEVMLHLPMQAVSEPAASTGRDVIQEGMAALDVQRIIASDLESVPYAKGVNNHMGSRATADGPLMSEVAQALASHDLYFIDSRTTASSAALRAARYAGLRALYRSIFLDDVQNVAYTHAQLRQFCAVVRQRGAAIAIGHPHPSTLEALDQFLPELDRDDIELVPPSKLVGLAETANLWPSTGSAVAHGD